MTILRRRLCEITGVNLSGSPTGNLHRHQLARLTGPPTVETVSERSGHTEPENKPKGLVQDSLFSMKVSVVIFNTFAPLP